MEKRLLVAAFLSFLVLFFWYSVISPPVKLRSSQKTVNTIDSKASLQSLQILQSEQSKIDFIEEKKIIKLKHYDLEFTSRGGNLSRVTLSPYQEILPIKNIFSLSTLENEKFELKEFSQEAVVYVYEKNGAFVKKEYKFNNENGLLDVRLSGRGLNGQSELKAYELDLSILGDKNNISNYQQEKSLFEYVVNSGSKIYREAHR